ncbi:hypothetical protein [Actinorugispora endophytica]|uniref:Uncharacterized protein n=1 Tax=Actinorugispora endophytica TaxID=1605990 RepID=A0A4R6V5M3_9ACTN|nr:hypothetical protein [Actinorugispora endophytica]TDQ54261.1 hypothetical protein EV190_10294 [Actinorugispora endophytica]
MTVTLAQLTERSGLDVLDHLEREAAVPVIDGLQAQGDLIVVPRRFVVDDVDLPDGEWWSEVPPEGVEVLRSASGGNPHTLVADPGTCRWTTVVRDRSFLALGAITTTAAYLVHAGHGATGIAPGGYVARRQREGTGNVAVRRASPSSRSAVTWLVAD